MAMRITGMLTGSKRREHVEFPAAGVLGLDAGESEIREPIRRHGAIFVTPSFTGGVGGKGREGSGPKPGWRAS
jgi:hypothetical protein